MQNVIASTGGEPEKKNTKQEIEKNTDNGAPDALPEFLSWCCERGEGTTAVGKDFSSDGVRGPCRVAVRYSSGRERRLG